MRKKQAIYTDAPRDIAESLARSVVVEDVFPPPEKLIFKQSKMKMTISLAKNVVDFFKEKAQEHNTKYQTMINAVLENYVRKYA